MTRSSVTSDTSVDLWRGRDLLYFAEHILGVKPNRAQRRWAKYNTTPDGKWRTKGSAWVAANQVGKSLWVSVVVLWATIYKVGLDHSDPQAWIDAPYNWFHVAPSQQQAYIPLRDIEALVRGSHPAQGDRSRLPAGLIRFEKLEQYYEGITTPFGATAQFRTTEDKAKALQGRRAHGISFDEAAFEIHLKAVINETLLMRLISTGGPLHIVSTPNGINDYFEVVQSLRDEGTEVEPNVWTTPDDWMLLWSTVTDNAGFGLSQDEIDRMERDLDPATKEQQLRGAFLEPAEAFFTPTAQVLQAFRDIPDMVPTLPGHNYVIAWDPSVASDPTAAYVLDVTHKPWQVVEEKWERKPLGILSLVDAIIGLHNRRTSEGRHGFNRSTAITAYDSTAMGGAIVRQMLTGLHPQRPINFGGQSKVKLDILANLRDALNKGDLIIPDSMIGLKREIMNYRLKDEKIQQDRVIALAIAAWIASKGFSGVERSEFRPSGRF